MSADRGAEAILAALDEAQRRAVLHAEGPLLVSGPPGCGKTTVLAHRAAHLVTARMVAAPRCLVVTALPRAATAMRERLLRLLPDQTARIEVHTLAALALSILRQRPETAGLKSGFRVASEAERATALALDFDVSMTRARQLVRAIARSRRHPEDADAQIADARASYRRALTRNNLIERDELVGHAARALAADADLAASCRAWFDHIAIDDIHEIDDAHARLLAALIGTHGNVCAAGIATGVADAVFDARLARFEREHRGCACVRLGGRYRADGAIALLAARLLAPPAAERAGGARGALPDCVTIHAAKSDFAEAEFVAATIEQMIGGQNFLVHARGGAAQPPRMLSLADFAILYRSAEQADILTEALARARIPFHTLSCRPLDEDAAVLALLARLDAAVPDVNRPLADALRAATEALILDGVFAPVDVAPAYRQLSALIGAGAESLAALDDAVAMADAADFFDAHAARVVLSTLGAADGLEFAVVFIVGVEDGVLPLYVDTPDARALEDDRLRLYRGMARAGERLVLSHARKRLWRGRMRALGASPFLRELGYEPAPGADAPARALPGPQLRLI